MNFWEAVELENNTTLTENGALAYKSTLNANLDFFATAGSEYGISSMLYQKNGYRANRDLIIELFNKAYAEDNMLALANLLHLRDPRGGQGRREIVREIILSTLTEDEESFNDIVKLLPKYGRWDDVVVLFTSPQLTENNRKLLLAMVANQLSDDLVKAEKGEKISLLAKWLPTTNVTNKNRKALAYAWANALDLSPREYTKILVSLRKYIGIVENNLRTKNYTFDYSAVPSRAMKKYFYAFLRRDEERFNDYLSRVKEGTAKMNTNTLAPYEITRDVARSHSKAEIHTLNTMWSSIKNNIAQDSRRTIVVRDGSGSMTSSYNNSFSPLDVANSVTLLLANALDGAYHNKFITFSSDAEMVTLPDTTLDKQIEFLDRYDDYTNTNIEKVLDMIGTANSLVQEQDRVERIVIVSDMEFDMVYPNRARYSEGSYDYVSTIIDGFIKDFENRFGYRVEIVFWNVNAKGVVFPTIDSKNIKLVSGFSQAVLNSVINDTTYSAEDHMLDALDKYIKELNQKFDKKLEF